MANSPIPIIVHGIHAQIISEIKTDKPLGDKNLEIPIGDTWITCTGAKKR